MTQARVWRRSGRRRRSLAAWGLACVVVLGAGGVPDVAAQEDTTCDELVPAGPDCRCPNKLDSSGNPTCVCPTSYPNNTSGICDGSNCPEPQCTSASAGACAVPDAGFCPNNACWFSFVVLPDTQGYVRYNGDKPVIFDCQTEWIKANKTRLKIEYVLHVGDVVNNDSHSQWQKAKKSMCVIDPTFQSTSLTNPTGGVPYLISPGNMDNPPSYPKAHEYFPFSLECPASGVDCDSYDGQIDYAFRVFDVCGADWMPVSIRWASNFEQANSAPLDWLKAETAARPNHRIMMVTHSLLEDEGQLLSNDDVLAIWNEYASQYPNVSMSFNGHDHCDDDDTPCVEHAKIFGGAPGPGTLEPGVRPLWAAFSNFQAKDATTRQAGALAVVNVCPSLGKVRVTHYSPWWDDCYADLDGYQYTMPDDPNEKINWACGDGIVGSNETCDDGNTLDGDCCSNACTTCAPNGTPCTHVCQSTCNACVCQ